MINQDMKVCCAFMLLDYLLFVFDWCGVIDESHDCCDIRLLLQMVC